MIVDNISIFTAVAVSFGAFFLQIEKVWDWFLVKFVKVCLVFPKTSKFKELQNQPLRKITVPKFSDAKLGDTLRQEVVADVNMKIYGVTNEVLAVLRCLIYEKDDLILSSMDYIVISKMGMEILIVENEEKGRFDRSLFIDLTYYRQAIFQYHFMFSILVGIATFLLTGNEEIRTAVMERLLGK